MPSHSLRIPELLAPAGGAQALYAAVANGADAVYVGLGELNARRGAENFDLAGLEAACRYAHLRDRKVYLTANVVILADEMERACRLVADAWLAGVDAVIIQDLGLLSALGSAAPQIRLHASTQMNVHNSPSIRVLAELGVSRVTLARETSVDELSALATTAAEIGVEVESFVHGALCVCYSGQCLLSSLIGGRSANRGLCAQPCRMAYSLVDGGGSALETEGQYLLSPRDLAGIGVLPQLVDSGVSALKIEGRMKSPEYVALVTGVYRKALDRIASDPESYAVRDGEWDVLEEAFSRGFSSAYLTGERGNRMMSYTRPNNRGVMVGRVIATGPGTATVSLDRSLDAEDTLEFWTRNGRFAQRAGMLTHAGPTSSAPAGAEVRLGTERPVAVGDRVFRVANAQMLSAARRTFARGEADPPIPLRFRVRVVVGDPLEIVVTDSSGRSGSAAGAVVERARTRSVTSAEVIEHVGRLGGTPYEASGWEVDLSPDAGLGFSALHHARRTALEDYERHIVDPARPSEIRISPPPLDATSPTARDLRLVASADRLPVALVALASGADEVHVPADVIDPADGVPPGVVPVLPRIAHDDEIERSVQVARASPAVVAGSLGLVSVAVGTGSRVQSDWSLNVVNPWSTRVLRDAGVAEVWASPELSARQLADLSARGSLPLGASVYGRQEVMVTEHCILAAEGACDGRCAECARRQKARSVRDRKGFEFPVRTDRFGRSHIYNSVPLDLSDAYDELARAGLSAVRLDFTDESPDEVARLTRRWKGLVSGGSEPAAPVGPAARKRARGTRTTGHFFRGIR